MRISVLAAGFVLAALIPVATATPQATRRGTIGGQVLGTDGKAVSGARVTLQASEGKRPKTTETNEQGHFWFPSLPAGLYDVRAYSEGRLSDWHRNVWVGRGKQTNVTLRLRSKKPVSGESPAPAAKP
jgi:protocatechuate 3,4-dioxygenase beta subunit